MRLRNAVRLAIGARTIARSERRFRRALDDTGSTQRTKLAQVLRANERTRYGIRYDFRSIRSVEEYQARVPLADYEAVRSDIDQLRQGVSSVLTRCPVQRLHFSSGTDGRPKLIPFTAELRTEFFAGIGPWLADLQRRYPEAMSGPSHWVISPPCAPPASADSKIPAGFDDDDSYLPRCLCGGFSGAVPRSVSRIADPGEFFYRTALHLLAARDLALLSMWSPTYFDRLVKTIVESRERLLEDLARGARAAELKDLLPRSAPDSQSTDWNAIWPSLRLLSCWRDGWSKHGAQKLAQLFPRAIIQGKGLMATEAFMTLPYASEPSDDLAPVLSVCSHFFEFLPANADGCLLAHQLEEGCEYEIVVTTAGGLYRYRVGDRVRCEGFLGTAPRLRFLGRVGIVSDLCGEKLYNAHVEQSLAALLPAGAISEGPAFLAPITSAQAPCYGLFISAGSAARLPNAAEELDRLLRTNYYYDQSRRAGQLGPIRTYPLTPGQQLQYRNLKLQTQRESTMKPKALESAPGWERYFEAETR